MGLPVQYCIYPIYFRVGETASKQAWGVCRVGRGTQGKLSLEEGRAPPSLDVHRDRNGEQRDAHHRAGLTRIATMKFMKLGSKPDSFVVQSNVT